MIGNSRKNALYFAKYIDFFQTQITVKVVSWVVEFFCSASVGFVKRRAIMITKQLQTAVTVRHLGCRPMYINCCVQVCLHHVYVYMSIDVHLLSTDRILCLHCVLGSNEYVKHSQLSHAISSVQLPRYSAVGSVGVWERQLYCVNLRRARVDLLGNWCRFSFSCGFTFLVKVHVRIVPLLENAADVKSFLQLKVLSIVYQIVQRGM